MELTEICGNSSLYFEDLTFGLPICATTEHFAVIDSETEYSFDAVRARYFKQMETAMKLQVQHIPFDLRFLISGHTLSDTSSEGQPLYFCRIQTWNNQLAVDLALPGTGEVAYMECNSSFVAVRKALKFAFGGFLYTCYDFKTAEVDLSDEYLYGPVNLYCVSSDKQVLLNGLFGIHRKSPVPIHPIKVTH